MNSAAQHFERQRARLLGISYRMTGSMADAEDIVQEAGIRWLDSDHASIESPDAWLTTVVTRLALDQLKSARVQRTRYVGPWLPEPAVDGHPGASGLGVGGGGQRSPEAAVELDESITMALLLLLECLTPTERAAYILHDLFHYEYGEIGAILDRTESACRKLASRARAKIGKPASRTATDGYAHRRLVEAFFFAIRDGNLAGLVRLFAEDVHLHPDGGGKAAALETMLTGADAVSGFLLKVVRPDLLETGGKSQYTAVCRFNGAPGLVVWQNGTPVTAFNLEVRDGLIVRIHALRNPDKLRWFKRVAGGAQPLQGDSGRMGRR